MSRLSDADLSAAVADLEGWEIAPEGTAITREFRFDSFAGAMAWMVQVGFAAEKANHHPEWSNVYNRVEVRLTTHDSGGVTEKDIALAQVMDRLHAAA